MKIALDAAKPGQVLEIRAGDGRLEIEIAPTPMRLKKRGRAGSWVKARGKRAA